MRRPDRLRAICWRMAYPVVAAVASLRASPVLSQPAGGFSPGDLRRGIDGVSRLFSAEEIAALALVFGIIAFAVVVAIGNVRTRRRLHRAHTTQADLHARLERAEGLLAADQQVLVVWDGAGEAPEIRCEPGHSVDLPARPGDVLAFGKWLEPESAGDLDRLVDRLRMRGESFNVMLRARGGGHVEADGRTAGRRAVLRLRDLAGQRRELAEIHDRYKTLARDVDIMRAVLEAAPMPAWLRDGDGRLQWVNAAYATALGDDPRGVLDAGQELFDASTLRDLAAVRDDGDGRCVRRRLPVVVAGQRRLLDVVDVSAERRSAGIAVDVTEVEGARAEIARREEAHGRTLDKMDTGVAVFGPDGHLSFHNAAFRQMWPLEDSFLATHPTMGEILDRLRTERRLPEQADYRAWRARQTESPRPGDPRGDEEAVREELWHLPDGRIVRIVVGAHANGEVARLFEDVTETLDLESRFVALTRVQRETLDSLDEGIAVFGSDGRLKLHNPAFAAIWRIDTAALENEPHVEQVIAACRPLVEDDALWQRLHGAIAGLADSREPVAERISRPDGVVVDLRVVPLPDGASLAVFTDVSDSARIERALRDRNEALIAAGRIKNEFVHKVSYELRAPLTNIIGFAQLMGEEATGSLNERQREYTGYILDSSSALLAIINDILDLATLDAGVMELEISTVDIAAAVYAATDAIRDRLSEEAVRLDIDLGDDIGSFEADEKRVRQILFNLLSNAVGFSEPGQTVRLEGWRSGGRVVFTVADEGPGIPEDVRQSVFERFESHALGTRHRGVGLGLSIVKSFVELHGGEVLLDSAPGRGTRISCMFPEDRRALQADGAGDAPQAPAAGQVAHLAAGSGPANVRVPAQPASERMGRPDGR